MGRRSLQYRVCRPIGATFNYRLRYCGNNRGNIAVSASLGRNQTRKCGWCRFGHPDLPKTLYQPYKVHISRHSSEIISVITQKWGGHDNTDIYSYLFYIINTFRSYSGYSSDCGPFSSDNSKFQFRYNLYGNRAHDAKQNCFQ